MTPILPMTAAIQAAALGLMLPSVLAAQSTLLQPSFAVSERYDDNLFASPSDPQPTFVHGVGPRLQLEQRSARLSLVGRYTLDAEYLQEFPDQGLIVARQLGSIDLGYRPMKRLALETNAAYLDTRTSAEVGTATALDRGRVRARRFTVGSGMDYQLDRRARGELDYEFSRDDLLDLVTHAHVANAAVMRRFTRVDTASVRVIVRKFVFGGEGPAPSEVALLGWSRKLAPRTTASAQIGPRLRRFETDGVEATASLHHGVGQTEVEAGYTRAETATSGLRGSLETDTATVSATLQARPSVLVANAGFARTHGAGLQADVLYTRVGSTTRVRPWLSLEVSLSLSWQRLTTDTAPTTDRTIRVFHDVAALTFVIAPPKPLEL